MGLNRLRTFLPEFNGEEVAPSTSAKKNLHCGNKVRRMAATSIRRIDVRYPAKFRVIADRR